MSLSCLPIPNPQSHEKMQSNIRRFAYLACAFACLVALVSYTKYRVVRAANLNQLLVERSSLIDIGDSFESVKEVLSSISNLTVGDVLALEGSDIFEFRCSTPLQIGAKNWVLIIFFVSEKAVALGFRTEDSDYEMPEGAPKDCFSPEFESVWRSKMSLASNNQQSR